jgi:hypothetical protein
LDSLCVLLRFSHLILNDLVTNASSDCNQGTRSRIVLTVRKARYKLNWPRSASFKLPTRESFGGRHGWYDWQYRCSRLLRPHKRRGNHCSSEEDDNKRLPAGRHRSFPFLAVNNLVEIAQFQNAAARGSRNLQRSPASSGIDGFCCERECAARGDVRRWWAS